MGSIEEWADYFVEPSKGNVRLGWDAIHTQGASPVTWGPKAGSEQQRRLADPSFTPEQQGTAAHGSVPKECV
jgi:hypothetical protein